MVPRTLQQSTGGGLRSFADGLNYAKGSYCMFILAPTGMFFYFFGQICGYDAHDALYPKIAEKVASKERSITLL